MLSLTHLFLCLSIVFFFDSPLSSSITISLFHYGLKTLHLRQILLDFHRRSGLPPRSTTRTVSSEEITFCFHSFTHFYSAPQSSHCKHCTSYSNSVRLSVCLSVCLSHAGIVSKRLHVARRNLQLHCQIAKCV